jgi:hypothetical protein
MTQPAEPKRTPMDILFEQQEMIARQGKAIEQLMTAVELVQMELQSMRRRVQALEGVPWPETAPRDEESPEQEPPDPG